MNLERKIEDVVETIRNAHDSGRCCSLLIGAGCSVKAGVPLASGFVDIIKKDYPQAYKRAQTEGANNTPTYPQCMGQLTVNERHDLIAKHVDNAKINWAHVCISLLLQNGYVDRVLTTNFDLLVAKACALIHEFPATYDFATSQLLTRSRLPKKAVFYLHGQRTGFILINTTDDYDRHTGLLKPVFEDAGSGRVWIVAGYSGDNDPVFGHLANVPQFDNGLYWVSYKDNDPGQHVKEKLLCGGKDAFLVKGYDADSFFVTLTQKLGIFPPDLVAKPFSHLSRILKILPSFPVPEQSGETDVLKTARTWVQDATKRYEKPKMDLVKIERSFMEGKYQELLAQKIDKKKLSPELTETIAWANIMRGNELVDLAERETGAEAYRLFDEAGKKYAAALKIKPDMHEALYNLGNVLSNQAKLKTGAEADRLFTQACTKYEAALKIKPDKHEALYNYGNVLSRQAKLKTGAEADRLLTQACIKYEAVLKIKPDYEVALHNLGHALSNQAKLKTGAEADRLFAQACTKYEAVLKIKPDDHQTLNNWGIALMDQSKLKTENDARKLYVLAREKLENAEMISPGCAAYNLACLTSLMREYENCEKWLNKSYELSKLPTHDHIMNDSDLDNVRNQEWFKEFVKKISKTSEK